MLTKASLPPRLSASEGTEARSGKRTFLAYVASFMLLLALPQSVSARVGALRSTPIQGQVGSNSAAEAATLGLIECAEQSITREYGGAVFELGGKFYHTSIVTSDLDRELGAFKIAIPDKARLVALFHSHPKSLTDDQSDFFSYADIKTAKEMGIPSYVGVLKSGKVIGFDPSTDKTYQAQDSGHISSGSVSRGHPVGVFTVPGIV